MITYGIKKMKDDAHDAIVTHPAVAAVSVAEAQEARRSLEAEIGRRVRGLVPAQTPAVLNQAALYGGNLISGVVDGASG